MLVKYWMSEDVITVSEDASLEKASKLMKEHSIKHLPVMKDGRLTGIVSDRDLKEAKASDATALEKQELSYLLDQVKIKDLMTIEPFTTTADEIVERAANIMLENDISALPVVNEKGKLEGIITKRDLFRAMITTSGVKQAQLQFGVEIEDKRGAVKTVTDLVRVYCGRVVSITTHYNEAPEGFRHVYIRCKEVENEGSLFAKLEEKVRVLYRTHFKLD